MKHPLAEIRETFGLTRKEMAAVMEITYQTYNVYVNGASSPGKKKLKLVADFFGLDYEELVNRVEEYKRQVIREYKLKALEKVKPQNLYKAN